jgi:hypothetical protein
MESFNQWFQLPRKSVLVVMFRQARRLKTPRLQHEYRVKDLENHMGVSQSVPGFRHLRILSYYVQTRIRVSSIIMQLLAQSSQLQGRCRVNPHANPGEHQL